MNANKQEFYKRLYEALTTQGNVIFDGRGKTTAEITKIFNDKFGESKKNKEIVGGLLLLARKGIARKIRYNVKSRIETFWLPTGKDFYDLVYET